MKLKLLALVICLMLPSIVAADDEEVTYPVAHTRYQHSNMVVVVVDKDFFQQDEETQEEWYTAVKQCVRSANLAGQTIIVSDVRGRLKFYGPRSWHKFLRTLDMDWVYARVNKELTCEF